MSRQVLPIVGAVIGGTIGFVTGGPAGAFAGAQYGFTAGSIIGSYTDPIIIQGNKIGDSQLQVAAEGGARAIAFGRGCITATCVIARGNRIVEKKREGGKGSGPKVDNEYVTWTYAIGLGEAIPGGLILRIWQDENLVYDVRPGGQRSAKDNAAFAKKFRFYDGSETQMPDPDLQVFLGEETPYFRGTAYVVFPNSDLTNTSERIPIYKFEVADNGANGIISGFRDLSWDFPCLVDMGETCTVGADGNDSFTLAGDGSQVYDVVLKFFGSVESRHYINGEVQTPNNFVKGGTGDTLGTTGTYNVYKLVVSNPPETYYINHTPSTDVGNIRITLDGSQELTVRVASNAVVSFINRSFDGEQFTPSQWARAEVVSVDVAIVGNPLKVPLWSVVSSLMFRAGIESDQYDVSELDDQLAGVVIQESMVGTDAINAITAAYFADPSEFDGKLRFIKRGKPIVRVLTIDDLVEEPDLTSRENAIEYPAKLHLFYQSPKTGYATAKATSNRYSPNVNVLGEGSVNVPVTFNDSNEPASIAAKLHKVMWNEAGGDFSWVVGDHCIDLVPSDAVGLSLRGVVNRARITAAAVEPGKIKLTMRKDRQSAYTADVQAIPLPEPTTPPPTTVSTAVLAVLDIPALVDSDDSLVYYTAMAGETETWRGGQVQRSVDGGASWAAISEEKVDIPMGRLTQAITAASQHYPDNTNVIALQLFDANNQLDDLTQVEWLSERGALAIQSADGSWEIMQYRDATDEGGGAYTLSMLQRGRLNTAAVAHGVDSLVVVLDLGVRRHDAQSSWLAATLKHRGVSYGTTPEAADIVTTAYAGNSQREWPVASFLWSLESGTVRVGNIVPRHRFGTEDSPLRSSNWSGYRIVCSNSAGVSITVDTTNSSATINASSLGVVSSVTVAQLNRITGAGPALSLPFSTVPPTVEVTSAPSNIVAKTATGVLAMRVIGGAPVYFTSSGATLVELGLASTAFANKGNSHINLSIALGTNVWYIGNTGGSGNNVFTIRVPADFSAAPVAVETSLMVPSPGGDDVPIMIGSDGTTATAIATGGAYTFSSTDLETWTLLGQASPHVSEVYNTSFAYFPHLGGLMHRLLRTSAGWLMATDGYYHGCFVWTTTDSSGLTDWRYAPDVSQPRYDDMTPYALHNVHVRGAMCYLAAMWDGVEGLAVSTDSGATWTITELGEFWHFMDVGSTVVAIAKDGRSVAINDGSGTGWDVVPTVGLGSVPAPYITSPRGGFFIDTSYGEDVIVYSADGVTWAPVE